MSKSNPKLDRFFGKAKTWKREIVKLRQIVLDCGLSEEMKWGQPCYTSQEKNIVIIHGFKEYCAILFFKGALLKDRNKILIRQTANVQSGRQIRFTDVREIVELEPILKAYIEEAVAAEKAGLKVKKKKTSDFEVADEFQHQLDKNRALKKAFDGLTPGRQRAYLLHLSGAKQSKTREARVEKCMPRILAGKGMDD